jgi:subtilisin-like proprotein convertase family protein
VLPDAAGSLLAPREDTAIVDAECNITRIEYVEVSFTATHSYSGDLRVRLISPRGYVSELAAGRICDGVGDACGRYDGWTFGSVRHLGEPAAGGWRLEVADTQADDIGTWNAWSIRFWGR